MQIGGKNMGVLVNRSVLHRVMVFGEHLTVLSVAGIQEINLQVEGPTLHVFVEVVEVGILIDLFKMRLPSIMLG